MESHEPTFHFFRNTDTAKLRDYLRKRKARDAVGSYEIYLRTWHAGWSTFAAMTLYIFREDKNKDLFDPLKTKIVRAVVRQFTSDMRIEDFEKVIAEFEDLNKNPIENKYHITTTDAEVPVDPLMALIEKGSNIQIPLLTTVLSEHYHPLKGHGISLPTFGPSFRFQWSICPKCWQPLENWTRKLQEFLKGCIEAQHGTA